MFEPGQTWVARGVADAAGQIARTLPEESADRAYCEGVHDILRHVTGEGANSTPLLAQILTRFDESI